MVFRQAELERVENPLTWDIQERSCWERDRRGQAIQRAQPQRTACEETLGRGSREKSPVQERERERKDFTDGTAADPGEGCGSGDLLEGEAQAQHVPEAGEADEKTWGCKCWMQKQQQSYTETVGSRNRV